MPKIEKMKAGDYRIRVFAGRDEDGRPHWKVLRHPDPKRLQRLAAEFADDHRGTGSRYSIGAALESYISAKEPILSPSTIRAYKSMQKSLETQYSAFCGLSAAGLTKRAYQDFIAALKRSGKSSKYIANIHGLLASACDYIDCPLPSVTLPERTRPQLHEPTVAEIRALLEAVAGTDLEIPVRLGIYGLRRGEICALEKSDVKNGCVYVHADLVKQHGSTYTRKETPKTAESCRIVPIGEELAILIAKAPYIAKYDPDRLSHEFARFLKRHGIQHFRFHDLRHFFAAYMHDQGLSDAQIMALGGWKTDQVMKRVYRYALKDTETARKAVNLIEAL